MGVLRKFVLITILTIINVIFIYFGYGSLFISISILLEHTLLLMMILYHDAKIFTRQPQQPKKRNDGYVGFLR